MSGVVYSLQQSDDAQLLHGGVALVVPGLDPCTLVPSLAVPASLPVAGSL